MSIGIHWVIRCCTVSMPSVTTWSARTPHRTRHWDFLHGLQFPAGGILAAPVRLLVGSGCLEVRQWGVGAVQEIDAAAMSLWLSYRHFSTDAST